MAGFTQDIGTINPDWTGASRGVPADRTFETLFGGLQDTIGNTTKVRDEQNQTAIRKEAEGMFESVNQDFGVAAPEDKSVFDLKVGESMPSGMNAGVSRIAALQAAFEQGKLSEVNYYGRLATLSKQLRSKYPGYEEIVDSTIMSVTGTRPANAYRDAILSELSSQANAASDSEKFKRQWIKENQDTLSLVYGDDFFQNPGKYDFAEVQARVAGFDGRVKSIQAETAALNLEAKRGEVNEKRAEKVISQDFSFVVESALSSGLGANSPGFNQTLQEVIESGGSPDSVNEFASSVTQIETELRTLLRQKAMKDYSGILTQDQINDQIEAALYPVQQAKQAILGGDFKLASRFALISKMTTDRQLNQMLQNSPEFRVGAGLREVSQVAADRIIDENLDSITTIGLEAAGRAMAGDKGILNRVIESGDNRVAGKTIDETIKLIESSEATGQKFSNLILETFGPSGPEWMDPKVIDEKDIEGLYLKFLNPAVTKAIVERGTPEDLATYTGWALEKFTAIPAFRAAAGDLSDVVPEGTIVEYDEKTHRLRLLKTETVNGETRPTGEEASTYFNPRRAFRAIEAMNRAFSVLGPIIEANGEDGNKIIPSLVRDLNIELESRDEGGFFKWLEESITRPIEKSIIGDRKPQKESSLQDPDFDGVIDLASFNPEMNREFATDTSQGFDDQTASLLDSIGQAEGAGYKTLYGYTEDNYGVDITGMTIAEVLDLQNQMAKDLGSSAVGKYQIMRYTLRDAIKALGLKASEKFTPELQDKIARNFLLKRRGYDKYLAGEIEGKDFLKNLSQEWASVPSTIGGNSFYAGDKIGNKATKAGKKLAELFG